jgi:ABC-type molybdate transport system substrate-binding protein
VRELRAERAIVTAIVLVVAIFDFQPDEVSCAIGMLQNSPHKANAAAYLAFLATAAGQDAYEKFGFVRARAEELALKPID